MVGVLLLGLIAFLIHRFIRRRRVTKNAEVIYKNLELATTQRYEHEFQAKYRHAPGAPVRVSDLSHGYPQAVYVQRGPVEME